MGYLITTLRDQLGQGLPTIPHQVMVLDGNDSGWYLIWESGPTCSTYEAQLKNENEIEEK